jgi:hypothetical protein
MSSEQGVSTPSDPQDEKVMSPPRSAGPFVSLLIALLAGGIAWTIVLAADPVFLIPEELRELPTPVPPELAVQQEAAAHKAALHNAMLILGVLGASVGGGLACGEGLVRRSSRRAAIGALVGAAAGAILGVLGAWLGQVVMSKYGLVDAGTGLDRTIRVQAAMLASLGLGVGLGLGLTSGQLRRLFSACLAGVLGGGLAALLYPIAAAVLLPNAQTESLIPGGPINRLLWIAAATGLLGLTIGGMRLGKRHAIRSLPQQGVGSADEP